MAKQAEWTSLTGIATNLLDGNVIAMVVAVVFTISVPMLLHYFLYRKQASPDCSNFLLLGPSGAGKTAFLQLLETKSSRLAAAKNKPPKPTQTSQTTTTATISLPPTTPTFSNRFRSANDPSLKEIHRNPIKYRLQDTPGHGKLRESQGLSQLQTMSRSKDSKTRLRSLIFMVDAAALSSDEEVLRDTATYLHDVLLVFQRRALNKGKSSSMVATEVPVLVAANKQDLFTALPPGSVRERLEGEIDRIRKTRSKGLMNAGAGDAEDADEEDILGNDSGLESFSFKLLEDEVGVKVDVVGGAVKGDDQEDLGSGLRKWEEWIGMCL